MQKRPEIANELYCLGSTQNVGRPTFAQNDQLLHTIQEISLLGCSADDRRSSEAIRSIRTLDGLTQELKKHEFTLSHTSVYLRLLPSRHNSTQGKRHVTTVPVKLCRQWRRQVSKFGGGAFEGNTHFGGGQDRISRNLTSPSLPKFLTHWIFFHTFFPKFFPGHF